MTKIKDIIRELEQTAPRSYQESYDNSGLLVGDKEKEVSGVLVTLDVIEDVVQEAIDKNCNLVIAHHPIIFKGLKSLTGRNYVERTVIKAIKHDIAIYAIHTNLDHVDTGVNKKICDKLGLQNTSILMPKKQVLQKLVTFVPPKNRDSLLEELYAAGAGNIGNYSDCSFIVSGQGTFRPNLLANPHIGQKQVLEEVNEDRVEIILPAHLSDKVISALKKAHPYEEVAYYLTHLENENQELGSGMVGELEYEMDSVEFMGYLKGKMNLNIIRHTKLLKKKIKRLAVCGGSGSFLLNAAKGRGCDMFVTADFKYHEFFDAENSIIIADIGHYESEVFTKELLHDILSEKFDNFALNLSNIDTNPISYYK